VSDPHSADGTDGPLGPDGFLGSDETGTDLDESPEGDYAHPGGHRRSARRGLRSCLVLIVVFAVVMGGLYVGLTKGISAIQDQFSDPADYPGPGTGAVAFEVAPGDSVAAIGRNLKDQGVVASVDAFIAAARADAESSTIQAGTYQLMEKMRASQAVDVLVDPSAANAGNVKVAVPEGLRVVDVVDILSESTGIRAERFTKVLSSPDQLGLPDDANGDPEGYLFPATYSFAPGASPASMLKAMVDRWRQAAESADLVGAAQRLGYTPNELMTIASLIEAEGRGEDMPKIARVIYNRLENPDNGITNGLLQIDATVNFALDRELVAIPTTEDLQVDSPYNTYANPGLPPGPIEAPGDAAIAAAANPVAGPWLFYITVNLGTGETKFTESYDEFLQFRQELRDYCANESERC